MERRGGYRANAGRPKGSKNKSGRPNGSRNLTSMQFMALGAFIVRQNIDQVIELAGRVDKLKPKQQIRLAKVICKLEHFIKSEKWRLIKDFWTMPLVENGMCTVCQRRFYCQACWTVPKGPEEFKKTERIIKKGKLLITKRTQR